MKTWLLWEVCHCRIPADSGSPSWHRSLKWWCSNLNTGCRLFSIHWGSLSSGFVSPIEILEDCQIKYNNFVSANYPRFQFSGNDILESLFADCNLTRSCFSGCHLEKTEFFRCDLSGANFENADGYTVDISNCKLKGAVFSFPEVVNLLNGLGITIK